jgi:RNA polymerase sigma factor (sigma-70 family)
MSPMSDLLQHLRRTVLLCDGAGLTDGELLDHYVRRRDDAALAALVRRHGPMVWGVCCRVLGNHHDAEDAFQAAFLVLMRKAAGIVPREMVVNWLHGVAYQTARKARATMVTRKRRERQVAQMPEPAAADATAWQDLQPVLDEELSRLPDRYRAVLVLCDLQGNSRKQAARQLGVPEGTVAGWIARARVTLAKRLARRGIILSGGALAVLLTQNAASAKVPAGLLAATIRVVSLIAAGKGAGGVLSSTVVALTKGVLNTMLLNNLKTALAVLVAVALVGLGSGGVTVLLAGDFGGRVGYQPPGVVPVQVTSRVITEPGEVALDAAGGRGKPYFYSPPDPANINHLWKLTPVGEYFLIESKLGELALDASGGKGNPYLRHSDPTNINQLWKLIKVDACYLLVPKVGDGELTLDANGGRGQPYLRKMDTTNNNHLWQLRKTGDYCMLIPLVRMPPAKGNSTSGPAREDLRRELEKLVRKAEQSGTPRQQVLEELGKIITEMTGNSKDGRSLLPPR